MKKIYLMLKTVVFSTGLLLCLSGCEDHLARYKTPPWLGGANIETLEKRTKAGEESGGPTYHNFIAMMDKSGYRTTLEAVPYTLFVPDDAAFEKYYQEAGISGIDALTKDQAKEIFTLHILRNPRSRFQLIYEYVWSELQGPDGEYAGLFFRKPTTSTSIPYSEVVKYYPDYLGDTLLMFTGNKLMPLFSTDYFEDFSGNPDGSDYLFIYRNSDWNNDMNWGPAMITESQVATANGFIYFIDRVVPPQPNIDMYLSRNQDKYGIFYDLMQRFATYGGQKTDPFTKKLMYLKGYDLVSNIAEEQGAFTGNEVQMKDMFTVFVPDDVTMQNYLDNTVLKYYSSIDSVPRSTLFYILQTQISRSLALISKIEKRFFNSFGDPMTVSRDMITDAHMCSNGCIYVTNKVLEPNVFTCVPGKLFIDKNYSTFLLTVNQANLTASLAVPEVKVTLFAPDNDAMESYGIRYDPTSGLMQYRGRDKVYKEMKIEELLMFVQDHIYNGVLDDLSGDGYAEMSSGNFIHITNNAVEAGENQSGTWIVGTPQIDKASIVEKNVNDRNGILYTTDNPIKSKYVMGKYILADPDFSKFAALLVSTELLKPLNVNLTTRDTLPNLKFLNEAATWTGFIPTNAAMTMAEDSGWIPTNNDDLKLFLQYHFIRKSTIFDDGQVSGSFPSQRIESISAIEGTKYATLVIDNVKDNMTVTDHSGQVVAVDHATANQLVRKGVAHKINHVLKY
jgi:uncharacterized surface protein with fasciclin (FAS1) repeats